MTSPQIGSGSRRSAARNRTPRSLLAAIALASAAVAAFADAAPTGHGGADVFWRALVGAVVPLAVADARRWSWFPIAGAAAAVGRGIVGLPLGIAALALTFASSFGAGRRRWFGALVGALSVQALLRGVTYGFTGAPTLVAVAATVPAVWSALRNASARFRRIFVQSATVLALVVGLLTVFTAVDAKNARTHIQQAIRFGDQAVAAASDGDPTVAAGYLDAAGDEMRAIADDFSKPWTAPARFVPLLGQHTGALREVAEAGSAVTAAADAVLVGLDPVTLLPSSGQVDVVHVRELVPRMHELRSELGAAIVTLDDIDDTWIVTPATDRIDELADTLTARFGTVTALDDVLTGVPTLLGGDGPRRYLVLFMTPAESRAAGGFAANWAELVADDGRISVARAGRGDELNDALPEPSVDLGPGPEFLGGATLDDVVDTTLYSDFFITEYFQNLPAIVDFPTLGRTAASFYQQATGTTVDGVIGADPDAMAALVRLSGPVTAGGRTFDANGLRDFVLTGQYLDYEDDEDARVQVLDDLTFGVFDTFVSSPPPSPAALVDVLAPLVSGDRLRMISFDPDAAAGLAAIGLDDPFPEPAGQDLLAVVTQNTGENKIDTYLERTIDYQAVVDPDTGATEATLTITLANTAPSTGLPDAIIGNNDLQFRRGTNRVRLQVYSPLAVTSAVVAGDEVPIRVDTENGWPRYQRDLFVDAESELTITLALSGMLDVRNGYVLDMEHQPLANPDSVTVGVAPTTPWEISTTSGIDENGRASIALDHDRVIGILFRR